MIGSDAYWETKGKYDLIVIGAGPAGIGASIAAARRGMKVALVESYGFAGGVATQSCCPIFYGFEVEGKQTTGGLSDEFVRRMDKRGAASLCIGKGNTPDYKAIDDRELNAKVSFDGEAMKPEYNRMLLEAGVECIFYTQLTDVLTKNGSIKAVLLSGFEGTYLLEADSFIDTTGNAQLAFLASPDAVNICPPELGMHNSMFFIVDGVKDFDIDEAKRIYSEDYKAGNIPELVWEHFGTAKLLKKGAVQIAVCFEIGDGADSRDMTRMDMVMRERVFEVVNYMKRKIPGFEECYLSTTSIKVGVRVSRNIVSSFDVCEESLFSDEYYHPVALCRRSYGMHSNKKGGLASSFAKNLSGIGSVPMGALISAKFSNLLAAGRCIGSSPELVGAFRMMNTCMTTGEAAGLMAFSAKQNGKKVSEVQYSELLPLLKENNFIL